MVFFLLMLHPSKPARKDGSKAVVLRATHERKRKYFNLSVYCLPENWDSQHNQLKKAHNSDNYKDLNYGLKLKVAKAEKIAMDFENDGKPFNFDLFKEQFELKKDKWTVSLFFDQRIKELTELGNIGNASIYGVSRNAFDRFNPSKSFRFQDINVALLTKYEIFLRKSGCANNTINNYIRTLRAIYNIAIDRGIVSKDHYPFFNSHTRSGYKIGKLQTATVKRAITMSDLKKILDFIPEELTVQQDAKLYFLFSYYAWGINFIDMAYLRWDKNIQEDAIVYSRIKTRKTKTFRVPMRPQLSEILDHYKQYDNAGYVFPIFNKFHDNPVRKKARVKTSLKAINEALTDMGKELKILTPLTTYVARHTFATTLKSKEVPASVIKEMMGHANEATTEIYLKEFSNDVLSVASEHLNIE